MRIEIFEMPGIGRTAAFDATVMRIRSAFPRAVIRSIDMRNKEAMRSHADVVDALKTRGVEVFPLFKTDGRLLSLQELQKHLNMPADDRLSDERGKPVWDTGF
ncbi:MAG: hypothetical protein HYY37_00665 [Candidatus Aenigmarchaeota archaeon]|nr:hypothetical protein [Candidatus Aenigmarchaeota archaeon]